MVGRLLTRPVGWPIRLREYASELRGRPFAWGSTDCASVVRGAVEIILGSDPWTELYRYTGEPGARRCFARAGGFAGALTTAGAVTVPLGYAMQGDVVVTDSDEHAGQVEVLVGGGVLGAATESGVYWTSGTPRAGTVYRLPGGSRVGTDG